MDFSKLLSLAKQNDHAAKNQLKQSKAPNLEFRTPAKVVKPQRDIEGIKARLQAHQERVRQEELAKKAQAAPQLKPALSQSKASTVSSGGQLVKKPALNGNASQRPSSVVPRKPLPSSSAHPKPPSGVSLGKPDPRKSIVTNGKLSSSSSQQQQQQSSKPSSSFSAKPAQKAPDHSRKPAPMPQPKPKPRPPAPPIASFHQLLQMAEQNKKASLTDDVPILKGFMPGGMPAGRSQLGVARPPNREVYNPKGRPEPHGRTTDPSKPSVKPANSRIEIPYAKNPGRPVPDSGSQKGPDLGRRGSFQKPPPPRRHMNSDKRPDITRKPGVSGPAKSGVQHPPQDKRDRPPGPSRSGVARSGDVVRKPATAAVTKGGPVRGSDASMNPGKKAEEIRPPVKEPVVGQSGIRQAPKSIYPERFNPIATALKKRPRPVFDEDEDYDDEMDDFIDDTPIDDGLDVSKEIREIFGYDRRRYIGREEDDDDLAHMESNVHQQWKEEALSSYIARKEDEREEELERQELARERAMKKAKKMRTS